MKADLMRLAARMRLFGGEGVEDKEPLLQLNRSDVETDMMKCLPADEEGELERIKSRSW